MTHWYPKEALFVLKSSVMAVFVPSARHCLPWAELSALPRPVQLSCYDLCHFPRVVFRVIRPHTGFMMY